MLELWLAFACILAVLVISGVAAFWAGRQTEKAEAHERQLSKLEEEIADLQDESRARKLVPNWVNEMGGAAQVPLVQAEQAIRVGLDVLQNAEFQIGRANAMLAEYQSGRRPSGVGRGKRE
jgi:biopolymer transport protein ExbB/TolQ